MNSRGFATVLLLIIILVVGAVGGAHYLGKTGVIPKFPGSATTSQSPAPVVEQPPVPPPVPDEDKTSNWKTYTDKERKISFKYPNEAALDLRNQDIMRVVFIGESQRKTGKTETELFDGYIFTVTIRDDGGKSTVDSITTKTYQDAKEACFPQTVFSDITSTTISGRAAKTYGVKECLGDYTEYFVANGKTIFEITLLPRGEDVSTQAQYQEVLDQILSTFKFLP